jgi:flagellar biosynthesis protein FlhB
MAFFDDSIDARTERPTARRRRQTREQGRVARSADLVTSARIVSVWVMLVWWLATFANTGGQMLRDTFDRAGRVTSLSTSVATQPQAWMGRFVTVVGPPLLMATSGVLVAHFLQVGWLWHPRRCWPQWSRISAIEGIRRLSSAAFGRAFAILAKLSLVATLAALALANDWLPWSISTETDLAQHLSSFATLAIRVTSRVALALLAWGVVDYCWQRRRFERSLQMTKDEVRQEMKELEVNPHIRQRRDASARQRLDEKTAISAGIADASTN